MSNALALYEGSRFEIMQRTAMALTASGLFQSGYNAIKKEEAIAKVMAGAELGIPPFAAMTGVNIINGKATIGANLMATLVKQSGRYNYRVIEHTENVCKIQFYENGAKCGVSEFTIQNAENIMVRKKGGVEIPLVESNKNWKFYPRNMLFARALSNGARWYCADVFGGSPVYTPDEMGQEVDEDGDIVDAVVLESSPPPQPETVVESVDDGDFEEVAPTEQELIPVYPLHVYLQDYDEGKKHVVRSLYNIDSICTKYNAPKHMMNALNKNDMVKARNQKILEAGRSDVTSLNTDLSKDTFEALAKWLIEREQG